MRRSPEEFTPERVNGSNVYDFIIHEDIPTFGGTDSQAIRVGAGEGWILHKFNRDISLARAKLMKEVTAEVAQYAPRYSANIGLWGHTILRVEPVIKVFQSNAYHQAFAVERYVGGYHPRDRENKLLDELLADFSSDMVRLTGHRGIEVCATNTKINRIGGWIGPFAKNETTATDICRYLTQLT